jgi:cytochrome c
VNISGVLILSLILLIIGLIFVYTYRQNINLTDLLNYFEDNLSSQEEKLKEEIYFQKARSRTIYEKAGRYGVIFLLSSVYLFAGAAKLAEDTARWGAGREVFTSILSLSTLAYFLLIVCLSILAASSVVIYFYFRPNSEYDSNEPGLEEVKSFTGKSGLVASLFIPLLIVFLVISLSAPALSYSIFLVSAVLLFVVILISSLYYLMIRNSEMRYSLTILFLIVVLFLSVVGVNVASFDSATKLQFDMLAEKYDAYKQKVLSESGEAVATVSGEDIYNGRCIACHKFDQKVVGPPYNEVLSKYVDNRAGLIKFILNPVKVNPDYPPMPSQGLKPNEAEAVADYIMSVYNQNQ